ncbi:MAG: PIN domain-containing protein [bacterium]
MRKVLIDLNIILDMLAVRQDHEAAAAVFDKCVKRKIKGYICSHEITTLSYFLGREKIEIKKRNKIINMLLDNLSVLTAHEKILRDALHSEIEDYEDAVIDELAHNEEIEFIITRDLKDFKKSKNSIYTAIEAIEIIDS